MISRVRSSERMTIKPDQLSHILPISISFSMSLTQLYMKLLLVESQIALTCYAFIKNTNHHSLPTQFMHEDPRQSGNREIHIVCHVSQTILTIMILKLQVIVIHFSHLTHNWSLPREYLTTPHENAIHCTIKLIPESYVCSLHAVRYPCILYL